LSTFIYMSGMVLYGLFTFILEYHSKNKEKYSVVKYRIIYVLLFILSILPLTLISGLRYNVGTDYNHTYAPHFIDENWDYSEFLFIWVNQFLRLFTSNPVILFLFMATVTHTFLQLAITRISPRWWFSAVLVVCINFFSVSLNQSRQMMSVAIYAYAFTFIHEHKLVKYLIFAILAGLFHYGCLILIPVYFIFNFKFVKKYYLGIFIVTLFLVPAMCLCFKQVILHTKYEYYFTNPNYYTNQSIEAYFIASLIVEGFAILWADNLIKKYGDLAIGLILLNGIALCIGFASFFIKINELTARTYLLFSFGQVFLIPMIVESEDNYWMKWYIVIALVSTVTLSSSYVIYRQLHHEIFPYRWIFNK